jgi:hypothetical protein
VEDWRRYVTSVVYAVQFDRQPVDAVDRLLELIVATDVLAGTPEDHLAAIRAALAGTVRLAELVPQPHPEGALRKLLRVLEGRLDSWVRHGPAVTPLPVTEWRPAGPSTVVAHLGREPEFLSRWLGVSFDQVPDEMGELRIAVLRLGSGTVVALVQVVGNPAPGTSLLQAGAVAPADVVREFLAATRLSGTVVEWVAGPAAARPEQVE